MGATASRFSKSDIAAQLKAIGTSTLIGTVDAVASQLAAAAEQGGIEGLKATYGAILRKSGKPEAEIQAAVRDLAGALGQTAAALKTAGMYGGDDSDDMRPTMNGGIYGGASSGIPAYIGHGEFYGSEEINSAEFVMGGCESCKIIGAADMALDTISQYAESRNSRSKAQLADQIIAAVSALGVKVASGDRKTQIASMLESMPKGKDIRATTEAQAKTCTSIAKAINKVYGSMVIDTTMAPAVVCQQVVEIMATLDGGMHTEFLAVFEDVRRVLGNLHQFKKLLQDAWAQLKMRIESSDDTNMSVQITTFGDAHEMIVKEMDRQILMLEQLLNIHLDPAQKDLQKLINSKKDIHSLIEKINTASPGSRAFSEVMASVLKGVGMTADFAMVIDRALKTVGMTVADYSKDVKNLVDLKGRIAKGLVGSKMSEEDLHEYLEASELLVKNFYRSQDIAEVLARKTGSEEMYGGYGHHDGGDDDYNVAQTNFSGADDEHATGAEDSECNLATGGAQHKRVTRKSKRGGSVSGGASDYPKTHLDRRVKDRKRMRELIFNAFYRQLAEMFNQFVASLHNLTKKVGTEIQMSDQLDGLRQALLRIKTEFVRSKNVYYALVGYYNDAQSKGKRDEVLGELRMVANYFEACIELPQYSSSRQYFADSLSHVKAMIALIGKYSDEIAVKFGRGEETGSMTRDGGIYGGEEGEMDAPQVSGGIYGGDDADDAIEGGVDADAYGGVDADAYGGADVTLPTFTISKTIKQAIDEFDYRFRTTQIRYNMQRGGKELANYSEKYEKIVANSIVEVLRSDLAVYQAIRKQISDVDVTAPHTFSAAVDMVKEKQAALDFVDKQWETKKTFWATVEAVDTYMRLFTDSLVKNTADIKDIKAMLDDVEVISSWYNNDSGNTLAAVFDSFPSALTGGIVAGPIDITLTRGRNVADAAVQSNAHYYEAIGADAAYAPGNPYLVALPTKADEARKRLRSVFTSLTVLKNLFSVFINIGSKFGGEELRKKVFMSPTKMHANLLDYLQASAFTQGFDQGAFQPGVGGAPGTMANAVGPHAILMNMAGVPVGVADVIGGTPGETSAHAFLASNGIWMRSAVNHPVVGARTPGNIGLRDLENKALSFNREDEYFVMMLKAIAAKIFTVTGMYDVIDRPMEFNGLSPIRMIIGGNTETPKVEEDGVALYLRLPLLMIFYRNIFNFDDKEAVNQYKNGKYASIPRRDNSMLKISMVPDIDGTFAGLIRLLFRKARFIDSTSFSDDDIKEIIRECNTIYSAMKSKYPSNTIMETIHELVAEVNRRYGIVSRQETVKYENEFGYRYDYAGKNDFEPEPAGEIAILPGEEDEEVTRPSAAQRLLGETFDVVASAKKSTYGIVEGHKKMLYDFRCMIDGYFENPTGDFSFDGAIKATQRKLRKETSDEARFALVAKLIRGTEITSKIDHMKYVMFHETVITGLNTLSAMHTVLARFKQNAMLLDLDFMEKLVWEVLGDQVAAAAAIADETALIDLVCAKLEATDVFGSLLNKPEIRHRINKIFGFEEDSVSNGGQSAAGGYILKQVCGIPANSRRINAMLPNGLGGFVSAGGLCKILDGVPIADIKRVQLARSTRGADLQIRRKAMMFIRFLFNRTFVMQHLVETLFSFGYDMQKLVDVRFADDRIQLSFGGLKKVVEDLFSSTHHFMEALRPHVSKELFDRFTEKRTPGSYYWLQEQINEKIIIGRPRLEDVNGAVTKVGYKTIDELGRSLNSTYQRLVCTDYDFDGSGVGGVNVTGPKSMDSYDNVLAEMIFYDATKPESGLIKSEEAPVVVGDAATDVVKLVDFLRNPYDQLHFSGVAEKRVIDTRFLARFKQLYSWKKEYTGNRSALFSFNQLIAKFIQTFYDGSSQKMYGGLIQSFAGGAFSRAITSFVHTYPDTAPLVWVKRGAAGDMALRPDPTAGRVLTNSQRQAIGHLAAWIKDTCAVLGYDAFTKDSPLMQNMLGVSPARGHTLYCAWVYAKLMFAAGMPIAIPAGMPANALASSAAMYAYLCGLGDAQLQGIMNPVAPLVNGALVLRSPLQLAIVNVDRSLEYPINEALRYGSTAAVFADGTLIRLMPAATAGGRMGSIAEVDSRADVFASAFVVAGDMWNNAGGNLAVFQAAFDKLPARATAAQKVYSDGSSSSGKNMVKYDDMLITDLENPVNVQRDAKPIDTGLLFFARAAAIPGVAPAGSIGNLEIPLPAAGADMELHFGQRADPDAEHVLFSSLANIIRNLVQSKNAANTSAYLYENVADVPLYMKEKMRANLPQFRNLFAELLTRCEFIKHILTGRKISVERRVGMALQNPWPFNLKAAVGDSSANKASWAGILDTIIKGCQVLMQSCEQSLKEIGDDPKYFETYFNSIKDYKNLQGVDPFMPLSSIMTVLRNVRTDNCCQFLPVHALGEEAFKFAYGTRSLLAQMKSTPQMEHVAGLANILEQFNSMQDSRFQIDRSRVESFMRTVVMAIRYVYEQKHIKGLLTPYIHDDYHLATNTVGQESLACVGGPFMRDDLMVDATQRDGTLRIAGGVPADDSIYSAALNLNLDNKADVSLVGHKDGKQILIQEDIRRQGSVKSSAVPVTYALSHTLADTLAMTESTFREDKIKEFVAHILADETKDLKSLEVRNIIDLNIVPINVHALMREVPLANLYNYAYSFDRMIIELHYGLGNQNAAKLIRELCDQENVMTADQIRSAKDMIVAMLISPYMNVDGLYQERFQDMMIGTNHTADIARPKFLSDQLYNKCLFGQLSAGWYSEAGPVADATARMTTLQEAIEYLRSELTMMFGPALVAFPPIRNDIPLMVTYRNMNIGDVYNRLPNTVRRTHNAVMTKIFADPIMFAISAVNDRKFNIVDFGVYVDTVTGILYNNIGNGGAYLGTGAAAPAAQKALLLAAINAAMVGINTPVGHAEFIDNLLNQICDGSRVSTLAYNKLPLMVGARRFANIGMIRENRRGHSVRNLTYIDEVMDNGEDTVGASIQPDNSVFDIRQVKAVNVDADRLSVAGKNRFDTVLVRNLIFIVNLYRSVRTKLSQDLTYSRDIIARSVPITRPQLTEFYGNQVRGPANRR